MSQSPFSQFAIKNIIPIELFGYDVSFTNSSLCMLIVTAAIVLFYSLSLKKISLVPGVMQNMGEMIYEFVLTTVKENIGEDGKKYLPLVFSIFLFVILCNLLGMLPYSFTVTSHIIVTFVIAFFIFILVNIIGFYTHGFKYFSIFLPAGTPWWLAPAMIVIELFSYLSRPISLSVRLAANMMAGHVLLKVLGSFVFSLGIWLGWVPISFIVMMTGFEIFVALLQAYIFTILTCVYLNNALNLH
jgi:F-type H+-transporting ATPase subunit a